MTQELKVIEREAGRNDKAKNPQELKSTYLIFEILNSMLDTHEYKIELKSEIVIDIINSLNVKNEAEEETINNFKEMLNIVSVSPHTLTLDSQEDVEKIWFSLKRYAYDIAEPYVLEHETQNHPFKLNQRKIRNDKYRIIKMKEKVCTLMSMLSILDMAYNENLGIIIYADFLEVIFK